MGDPGLLTEIFTNLLKNALEATPEGGEVSVEVGPLEQGLWVAIRNTGVGIPEDMRARIFEPFFTTKAEGTGLGLAIARQLIESHGGRISVESDGSTWTSFVVELPAISYQQSANLIAED
jgi:signal transduction histidine kinase